LNSRIREVEFGVSQGRSGEKGFRRSREYADTRSGREMKKKLKSPLIFKKAKQPAEGRGEGIKGIETTTIRDEGLHGETLKKKVGRRGEKWRTGA